VRRGGRGDGKAVIRDSRETMERPGRGTGSPLFAGGGREAEGGRGRNDCSLVSLQTIRGIHLQGLPDRRAPLHSSRRVSREAFVTLATTLSEDYPIRRNRKGNCSLRPSQREDDFPASLGDSRARAKRRLRGRECLARAARLSVNLNNDGMSNEIGLDLLEHPA